MKTKVQPTSVQEFCAKGGAIRWDITVLVILVYCTFIRTCAIILSKVDKPAYVLETALLLETAPIRGKIQ